MKIFLIHEVRARSLCAELELSLHHGLDALIHVLNEVLLGATESTPVGDVEDAIAGVGVLTAGATDLDTPLVGNSLESGPVLGQLWEVDVDGGTEGSSEVGRARRDVTEVIVVGETCDLLNRVGGGAETGEDGTDIGTLLHGDNAELVLFVDPDEEGLGIVVEDTSALGPVAVKTAGLKETISFPTKVQQG